MHLSLPQLHLRSKQDPSQSLAKEHVPHERETPCSKMDTARDFKQRRDLSPARSISRRSNAGGRVRRRASLPARQRVLTSRPKHPTPSSAGRSRWRRIPEKLPLTPRSKVFSTTTAAVGGFCTAAVGQWLIHVEQTVGPDIESKGNDSCTAGRVDGTEEGNDHAETHQQQQGLAAESAEHHSRHSNEHSAEHIAKKRSEELAPPPVSTDFAPSAALTGARVS